MGVLDTSVKERHLSLLLETLMSEVWMKEGQEEFEEGQRLIHAPTRTDSTDDSDSRLRQGKDVLVVFSEVIWTHTKKSQGL